MNGFALFNHCKIVISNVNLVLKNGKDKSDERMRAFNNYFDKSHEKPSNSDIRWILSVLRKAGKVFMLIFILTWLSEMHDVGKINLISFTSTLF